MALRTVIGFVTLLIVALVMRKDLIGHLKYFGRFLLFAVFGLTFLSIGLAYGLESVSAALGSVMVSAVPLVTYIIVVFILREERFSVLGFGGLIIGVIGLALVVGYRNIITADATLIGALLIAGGFSFAAINGIFVQKMAKGIDPLITTTYFLFLAGIILTALAFIFESPFTFPMTTENILNELGLGVITTGSAYLTYYYLIDRAGAYFASFIFYFIPIFGLIEGHILLNEIVVISQIIGVAVILIGVYLINREKFKKG